MAYLRSGIDGGRPSSSLVRNRVVDIRGDLATGGKLLLTTTEPTVVDGNELGRIDFQAPLLHPFTQKQMILLHQIIMQPN
jgi:hypothetical protein